MAWFDPITISMNFSLTPSGIITFSGSLATFLSGPIPRAPCSLNPQLQIIPWSSIIIAKEFPIEILEITAGWEKSIFSGVVMF